MALKRKNSFFFLMSALFFLAVVPNGYSASLTTTFVSDNGQNGNMFEIRAIQPVIITGFDGNLEPPGANFRIYYKAGTYTGFEANPGAWTLVGTANGVVSNGDDVATPIPIPLNVAIPAGQTYSFYLTTDDPDGPNVNYTDGTAEHAVYVSDANIQILEGIGIAYPFGVTFSPRVWNGTVYYTLGLAVLPTPTLTGWGMIILIALLGIGSIHYLRRRRLAI